VTTMTAPTFSQIKAQVAAIRHSVPRAKVIGIHSTGRWTGEALLREGELGYAIHQCDSPLSFRLALRQPTEEGTTKVIITGLADQDLSEDILLRLAKRRLFQIDPWQIVRSLFDAHAVDPRLARHPWIAEALLERIPQEGYPPAAAGFLDAEIVWPLLLEEAIGLTSVSPDLTSLLQWSLDGDATARFRDSSVDFRKGATAWLTEKAGPVTEVLLHCIERLKRPDAVPIGLAASIVYHQSAHGKLEKATGKLEERFLRGKSPEPEHMLRWSTAATEVVRGLQGTVNKSYRAIVQRADEILKEIQADQMAYLSDTSPLGFDQRLKRMGEQLSGVLAQVPESTPQDLSEARDEVRRHDQASQESRRLERVEMALRLVRWLGRQKHYPAPQPSSFAEAAEVHLQEGGYVDWARHSLRSGDPVQKLSEAYNRLFEQVRELREQQNQVFGKLLADWTTAGSQGNEVIPVERILDEIVAPLAAHGPVLVIVVDGMSVAVCRELLADVTRHEWFAITEPGRKFNRPGLAAIPSVTEFSRSSLLSGRLTQGDQNEERKGFAGHPALVARSRSSNPPLLFHKAGLQEAEASDLATDVRNKIASSHQRVVGVVVNAVDDHLAKGEQIDTRWVRDEIKVLPTLLHEARMERRLVVLVSDHGHMLDCQSKGRKYDETLAGGERWRTVTGKLEEDEFTVEGSRVLVDGHRLIAPWSEQVRYGGKKNGYHGGLSPQEMIVPVAVLSSTDDIPNGWSEQPIDTPAWWDESSLKQDVVQKPVPKLKPLVPQPATTLFELEEEEAPPIAAGKQVPDWIIRLLECPVFKDQKRLGGRRLPTEEEFMNLLCALDTSGGALTSPGLARALEIAPFRLPGLLAKAERVLNVDGYDVIRRDEASNTIQLNRDLLLKQFDLVE